MNVTMLGQNYGYSGAPLGADSSSLSDRAKEWVALIMEKGLPYYEAQKNVNVTAAEQTAKAAAFKYLIDNKLVDTTGGKGFADYTPWIIGGVVVVLLLGGGAFAMKRRRR